MRREVRLQLVIDNLNMEYPNFLKAVHKKEPDKVKLKSVLKHNLWILLEELKILMTKEVYD